MTRFKHVWIAMVLVICISCGGSDGGGDDDTGDTNTSSTLSGKVVDPGGNAIGGVSVSVVGGNTTTTDATGIFSTTAGVAEDRVVMFSKQGYVGTSKMVDVFSGLTSSIYVTMATEASPVTLDSTMGGTVSGDANAFITAPPNAFVDTQGIQASGDVDVHMTVLDPSDPLDAAAYPGNLLGKTLAGDIVPLRTYGVVDITVRKDGETLQIKDGENVTIGIPARSLGSTPDTSDMWYFDSAQGMWIEIQNDGTYDSNTHTYQTDVSHLTPYNSDNPYIPTCISGMVQDAQGNPVIAYIEAIPLDEDKEGNMSSDFTEPDGYFCMYVEKDTTVLLKVYVAEAIGVGNIDMSDPTLRTIETGGSIPTSQYPTDCSQHCTRVVPTITMGEPDPGPDFDEANCVYSEIGTNPADNPFWGTCAQALDDLYNCYAPVGSCTYEMDPLGGMMSGTLFEMEFENGSRMETKMGLFGPTTKLYGPDPLNELCGSMTAAEDGTITYTIDGEEISIRTTDSGAIEIECAGGHKFTLNGDQLDAVSGCSGGSGSEGSGVMCEAAPGTYASTCVLDSDCNTGLSCCGTGLDEKKCLFEAECDLYCTEDADCMAGTICCDVDPLRMCVDFPTCQTLQGDEVTH
jgi:hypothetical protein